MTFPSDVVSAVLHHMNTDHVADSLAIARAAFRDGNDEREVTTATMTGFDGDAAYWEVGVEDGDLVALEVSWPGGPIAERAEVRRELVAVTERACAALGIPFERH